MPKIAYRQKKLSADRLDKISKANIIIDKYRAKGYELTLRQLEKVSEKWDKIVSKL